MNTAMAEMVDEKKEKKHKVNVVYDKQWKKGRCGSGGHYETVQKQSFTTVDETVGFTVDVQTMHNAYIPGY